MRYPEHKYPCLWTDYKYRIFISNLINSPFSKSMKNI